MIHIALQLKVLTLTWQREYCMCCQCNIDTFYIWIYTEIEDIAVTILTLLYGTIRNKVLIL